MNISSAIFERSAPDFDSCPDESLPEFAFIGRSNVGKSSLLNMLASRKGLARVSATPGFTKTMNFFIVSERWRLVDLPGYGFAQVARKDSARFNEAVLEYLQGRPNIRCVFALIDSRLPPQKIDLEFVEWLGQNEVPFVLVFTKIDAVAPAVVRSNIDAFTACISGWFEDLPEILSCSATQNHGRKELLQVIEEGLTADKAERAKEAHDAAIASGVPIPEGRKARSRTVAPKRPNPARPW